MSSEGSASAWPGHGTQQIVLGAAASIATEAVLAWNRERKARSAIGKTFLQVFDPIFKLAGNPGVNFLNYLHYESEQGTSLDDFPFRFEIAGLTFQIGSVLPKDSLLGVHYEVTVVKNDLLGDDPRRVRKFRFHPGQLQCKWTILP